MENKIFRFQFEPVYVKQTRPNYSVGSNQDEAETSMTVEWRTLNGAAVKNVKRCQPV